MRHAGERFASATLPRHAELLHISECLDPEQLSFDPGQPTVVTTYNATAWVQQWAGNRRVLSYLGDVRKLAASPAGRPLGAWFEAIGLALRRQAADGTIHAVADHPSIASGHVPANPNRRRRSDGSGGSINQTIVGRTRRMAASTGSGTPAGTGGEIIRSVAAAALIRQVRPLGETLFDMVVV